MAPDGVSTTFFGFIHSFSGSVVQCDSGGVYPLFLGTSAAAPHAAAVAALLRQAAPTATPDQIYASLRNTASDMKTPGFDYSSGYGFIQADAALNSLVPAPSGGGGGGGGGLDFLELLSLGVIGIGRRRMV